MSNKGVPTSLVYYNSSDAKTFKPSWSSLHIFLFETSIFCRNAGIPVIILLSIYLTHHLGLSESIAAFFLGAASLIAVFGQATFGYLSDKVGRLKLLLIMNFLLFGTLICIINYLSVSY